MLVVFLWCHGPFWSKTLKRIIWDDLPSLPTILWLSKSLLILSYEAKCKNLRENFFIFPTSSLSQFPFCMALITHTPFQLPNLTQVPIKYLIMEYAVNNFFFTKLYDPLREWPCLFTILISIKPSKYLLNEWMDWWILERKKEVKIKKKWMSSLLVDKFSNSSYWGYHNI